MRKAMWLATAVSICAAAVGLQLACRATNEIPANTATARASNTARTPPASMTPVPSASPAAAAAVPPAAHDAEAEIRRVTIAELQDALKKNEAVIVDVRSRDAYDAGHIKGSVMLPEGEMDKLLDKLPKDKLIVTYCA